MNNSVPFAGFRANCLSPSGAYRFSQECRFVLYDGVGIAPDETRMCRKPSFYWREKGQFLPCCSEHYRDYVDVANIWDPKLFRRPQPRFEVIVEETGGNE